MVKGLAACLSLLVLFASTARADEGKTVDQVLGEKGILHLGDMLVFNDEDDLAAAIKEADTFTRKLREATAKIKTIEGQLAGAKNVLKSLEAERKALRDDLPLILDFDTDVVARAAIRVLDGRIDDQGITIKNIETALNDAKATLNATLEAFGKHVASARTTADEIRERYKTLPSDPEVSTALRVLSRVEKKDFALAESAGFIASCRSVERLEKQVEQLNKT